MIFKKMSFDFDSDTSDSLPNSYDPMFIKGLYFPKSYIVATTTWGSVTLYNTETYKILSMNRLYEKILNVEVLYPFICVLCEKHIYVLNFDLEIIFNIETHGKDIKLLSGYLIVHHENEIHFYNTESWKLVRKFTCENIKNICVTQKYLIFGQTKGLNVMDLETFELIKQFPDMEIECLCYDQNRIIFYGDNLIHTIDMTSWKMHHLNPYYVGECMRIIASDTLLVANFETKTQVWDLKNGEIIAINFDDIFNINLVPDEPHILYIDEEGTIKLWDFKNLINNIEIYSPEGVFSCVKITPLINIQKNKNYGDIITNALKN